MNRYSTFGYSTFYCAALWAVGALVVYAQDSALAEPTSKKFIPVPPVWSASGDPVATAWITAKAACDYFNSRPPAPSGLECGKLAEPVGVRDLKTAQDALRALVAAAARSIVALNAACREDPRAGSCPGLYSAARPISVAGGGRIAAISDDKDLDNSKRTAEAAPAAAARGGSPQAQFVEGLTNFVLDRAKLEAIAYFEERFHTALCEGDEDNLRVAYFPAVCSVLSNARNAGFSLASASRELRAAARYDLRTLPDNALEEQYLSTKRPAYALFRVWLALAAKLRDNTLQPNEAFAAMAGVNADICRADLKPAPKSAPQDGRNAAALRDCRKGLQAFALVGSALDLRVQLTGKAVRADLVDAALLTYRTRSLASSGQADPEKFAAKFFDALAALAAAEDLLKSFAAARDEIDGILRDLKNKKGAERNDALRELGAALARLADRILDLADATALAFGTCTASDCVLEGSEVRKQIAETTRNVRRYARLTRNVLDDQWTLVAADVSQLFMNGENDSGAAAVVGRFAPVITEISAAQSSLEVQKILNEAAAPAGSYREKFRGNTRSITAFVGYSGGKEYFRSEQVSGNGQVQGLFAPVGIHVTTPVADKRTLNGALGVYLSVLDLGPYATYRNNDSGLDKQPNIGFKQLVSPGAYLTYNFSFENKNWPFFYGWFYKSPWVVGIGASRTPALLQTQTGQSATSTRIQAFVAIDVTLFPF